MDRNGNAPEKGVAPSYRPNMTPHTGGVSRAAGLLERHDSFRFPNDLWSYRSRKRNMKFYSGAAHVRSGVAKIGCILSLAAAVMLLPGVSFAAEGRLTADTYTDTSSSTKAATNYGGVATMIVAGKGTAHT